MSHTHGVELELVPVVRLEHEMEDVMNGTASDAVKLDRIRQLIDMTEKLGLQVCSLYLSSYWWSTQYVLFICHPIG
jgi:hypothetical protein